MRVDIGSSRMMQAGTVAGWMLGAAGWVQIGMLRGESLLSGCAAGLGFIVLAGIMTRLLADGAVRASRDRWGRVVRRRGRRRVARLVLLGHADARLYWCTEPFWRWHSARRGGGRAAVAPPAADACGPDDIDEVCIVEVVQWGGVCLWLTVCPRYPDLLPGGLPRGAVRVKRPRTRRLCIPADAVASDRFHALCARCQAMRRGAGFLSPW
ncbi:hypothetical protein [Robbsia andropogonis]|uniref:hypothetical protein n=1 Tax=Robbsia andropogonis TaxID=28092 RepID=UPI00046583CD|nr:hypothetical protein [Robbsia andropogonis]